MTYRAHALRRAATKRAALAADRRLNGERCNKPIGKCVEAGSHQPPCRCVLWKGHSSYCSSVPLLRADRIFV
jgi:hypothetical protein